MFQFQLFLIFGTSSSSKWVKSKLHHFDDGVSCMQHLKFETWHLQDPGGYKPSADYWEHKGSNLEMVDRIRSWPCRDPKIIRDAG